jgi:putative addiction module killer protein
MVYTSNRLQILKSGIFDTWFIALKDRRAKARIAARIDRLALGNAGDVRPVGSGVSELRVDHGPGYRVYFQQRGPVVVILLCGGDKRTQSVDITQAIELAKSWSG